MANWHDIVGSIIIGSLVLFVIVKMNYRISTNSTEITSNGMVQSYLTTISTVMENDLYKIGYRVTGSVKLNIADSNQISYNAFVNNDGSPSDLTHSIKYYLGTVSSSKYGANPNDKPLLKVFDTNLPISKGVVRDCHFTYYDSTGRAILSYSNPTNPDTLSKVRVIKVYLKCESPYIVNNNFQTAEYSRKIKPVNLK
jgi:hypothetical protein